jgi:hypothetical protein
MPRFADAWAIADRSSTTRDGQSAATNKTLGWQFHLGIVPAKLLASRQKPGSVHQEASLVQDRRVHEI